MFSTEPKEKPFVLFDHEQALTAVWRLTANEASSSFPLEYRQVSAQSEARDRRQ